MMPEPRLEKIGSIAEINPKMRDAPAHDETVSFVPMATVDAAVSTATASEQRTFRDDQKGYTPFIAGDILPAKITPCFENGKIAQIRIPQRHGFGSTEFHILRPNASLLDARYLLHFLRRREVIVQGRQRMTGSAGQRRVPEHFVAGLEIPLHSLARQRRIAEVLDRAEALQAKRRATLALLETLTQSLFLEMFGDPELNSHRWHQLPLGELVVSGPQNGLYRPAADYGEGTRILRIDGFYDGFVTSLDSLKRVRIAPSDIELFALRSNDIVINRVNSREYLGKSALIPQLSEPVVFESNMMRFRLDVDRVEPRYAIQFLQTSFIRMQIARAAKDAVNQSSINQQDVRAFRMNLPPLELQRRFCERAATAEKLKIAHRASLARLDELFASLQHRAFRGEL